MTERLVSVAIIRDDLVHYGHRTHTALRADLGDPYPTRSLQNDLDGFYTSEDRFLTREEAIPVGIASGQIRPNFRGYLVSASVRWDV